jgi:hypothetical protein
MNIYDIRSLVLLPDWDGFLKASVTWSIPAGRCKLSRQQSRRGKSVMIGERASIDLNFRKAFDLLLKMRQHQQAEQILGYMVGYMKTLLRQTDAESPPVIVSVQAIRLRQP